MPEAQEQGARWRAGLPAALGLQFDGGLLTAAARRAGGELGRDEQRRGSSSNRRGAWTLQSGRMITPPRRSKAVARDR